VANGRLAAEQGDEADEAFGGTNARAASGAHPEVPPHARVGQLRTRAPLRSLSPVFGRLDEVRMTGQARTIRHCLTPACAMLLVACATTRGVAVHEWPKGEFVYTLDDSLVQLSLSREHTSQFSQAERFLTDFSQRLKKGLPSLEARGYLPAMCDVWIVLFSEPQVSCTAGRLGPLTAPPPVGPLEQTVLGALPPVLPSVGPTGYRKVVVLLQSQRSH
jgi:hypothetical protein